MSTTKDHEKPTTESKPQPPAAPGKPSELPTEIPDFPGDNSGSGSGTKPTGQ